ANLQFGSEAVTLATSAPNPSLFGQAVTFTATVTPVIAGLGTPTGTVSFLEGTTTLATTTLSAGQGSFTTSSLAVGSHDVTVASSGDNTFLGSTSSILTQTVNRASSAVGVATSLTPSVFGQAVTFTATVTAAAPGAGMPTGSVQFQVDS